MTEGYDGILFAREGALVTMAFNRPQRRNAFTPDMRRTMMAMLADLQTDDDCRGIVITGAGEHFCSGADLSQVSATSSRSSTAHSIFAEVHEMIRLIRRSTKPIIAAIEGVAWGGGLSIALACDEIVVASDARLGQSFSTLGIIPDLGMMYTLSERVGAAKARMLAARGFDLSGRDAAKAGLADIVAHRGEAVQRARERLATYADLAPLSIRYVKEAFARGMHSIEQAFDAELKFMPTLLASDDFAAAIGAFKSRSKPAFKGR